jgi:hypothetical protein
VVTVGNSLDIDLTGKVVIFGPTYLAVPATEHPFLVRGGFGAKPHTHGRALLGTFLSDGEDARMEGYMVDRLATDEEIAAAPKSAEVLAGAKPVAQKYVYTVNAFDRTKTSFVWAESEEEAREKALGEVHFKCEVKPAVDVDEQVAEALAG